MMGIPFKQLVLSLFFLLLMSMGVFAVEMTGMVSGVVLDRVTRQPVPSADVVIVGRSRGAAADLEGRFRIGNLAPGTYNIQASAMGYESVILSEVRVRPGKATELEFLLPPAIIKAEEVEYRKKNYFISTPQLPTSSRSLRYEEISRAPGAEEDVQRMIQSLPGVAGENDQNNEIVVRGGSPYENLIVIDGLEVDNINHFGYQGSTGGPISAIDPEFLRDVTFASGGFSARYGDRLSSVLALDLREGNHEQYHGNVGVSMAGAGTLLEGPLPGKKGSFMFSWRKSYLDLIHKTIGLTAVPNYWDTQGVINLRLHPRHSLTIFGLYGSDDVLIKDDKRSGFSRGAESADYHGSRYYAGARLRSLWGIGFTDLIIGRNYADYDIDVFKVDYAPDSTQVRWRIYSNRSNDILDQVHLIWNARGFGNDEWSAGLSLKPVSFDYSIWMEQDTTVYLDGLLGPPDGSPDTLVSGGLSILDKTTSNKYAAFLQYTWRPVGPFSLTGGVRYDAFAYPEKHALGPRFSASWDFYPRWRLSLAYGEYYQSQPTLAYLQGDGINRSLPYSNAVQYVAGIHFFPRESTMFSIEAYLKDYSDLPISEETIHREMGDETFRSKKILPERRKTARGIEMFAQQKMAENWYGIFSYSYGKAIVEVPGLDPFPADYDYRHVLSITLGFKTSMTRFRRLKQKKWFWLWTLPLPVSGDELALSTRFRYISGRPYTGRTWYDTGEPSPLPIYEAHWEDESLNNRRYPPYARWDVRLDNKWFFGGSSIVTYIEIQNVLDRKNVAMYAYADDGSVDTIYQFRFFFVGGFRYEF